ncbi:MAG: Unknown protein [uncultured Sulfurovum sp.]|uniref:Lipoprotein n=1 Tax=uncultured Sulfurovum sp. TaxID=269237 RepID=A0A6S6S035_9BACT|nr:MAG: Unknown protein [uncultured Sulfurovum sp.]
MSKLKKVILTFSLLFFTACGTETAIDPNRGFDMWDYMTSASNYEVEYDIYEDGLKTDFYTETHRQLGSQYERESANGLTTLLLSSNQILMNEPSGSTEIIRFLQLGDSGIFHSSTIQLCSLKRFYDTYKNKSSTFYNVLQVSCTLDNNVYQELYYAYNEGIVSMYEESNGLSTEYVKISERAIF